eukprot:9951827-Alexandrium_andersonii.AAC.1
MPRPSRRAAFFTDAACDRKRRGRPRLLDDLAASRQPAWPLNRRRCRGWRSARGSPAHRLPGGPPASPRS